MGAVRGDVQEAVYVLAKNVVEAGAEETGLWVGMALLLQVGIHQIAVAPNLTNFVLGVQQFLHNDAPGAVGLTFVVATARKTALANLSLNGTLHLAVGDGHLEVGAHGACDGVLIARVVQVAIECAVLKVGLYAYRAVVARPYEAPLAGFPVALVLAFGLTVHAVFKLALVAELAVEHMAAVSGNINEFCPTVVVAATKESVSFW